MPQLQFTRVTACLWKERMVEKVVREMTERFDVKSVRTWVRLMFRWIQYE